MSGALTGSDSIPKQQYAPSTLADVHEVLWRQRPDHDSDLSEWVKFHRYSASVYSQTAQVYARYQNESQQCAGVEIRKARDLEHWLNPDLFADEESASA